MKPLAIILAVIYVTCGITAFCVGIALSGFLVYQAMIYLTGSKMLAFITAFAGSFCSAILGGATAFVGTGKMAEKDDCTSD